MPLPMSNNEKLTHVIPTPKVPCLYRLVIHVFSSVCVSIDNTKWLRGLTKLTCCRIKYLTENHTNGNIIPSIWSGDSRYMFYQLDTQVFIARNSTRDWNWIDSLSLVAETIIYISHKTLNLGNKSSSESIILRQFTWQFSTRKLCIQFTKTWDCEF